jgi:hypothetical protein
LSWNSVWPVGVSAPFLYFETIAESVAFTVGAHYGFDSGIRSFPYVALWAQDQKVLEQNLADIRKVSTKIIDALESKVMKAGAVV